MGTSLQRLDQIHNPDVYDDTLPSPTIEASETAAVTLADHSNALISQLKRILRGDEPGNWFDDPTEIGPDFTDASLVALAARARSTFLGVCPSTLVVSDWVYISGPSVGGNYQVDKVDIANFDKLPAVGVIIEKPTTTTCTVQWRGEVTGLGSLVPRRVYFLQDTAKIGLAVPAESGQYVQRIGMALSSEVLLVSINSHLIKRA